MLKELAENFSTIDECKPSGVPDELLVTSSHDAVAIVSRKDGSTLFSAEVKNAHSAALLSDNLIAVASSDAKDGTGDRVVFFDRRRSNLRLAEQPIAAAHGLAWVPAQHTLWVLGLNQLMKLNVTLQASGVLAIGLLETYPLPEATGYLTYTVADPGGYWTTTLRLLNPPSETGLAASIYKRRWTTVLPRSCASRSDRLTRAAIQSNPKTPVGGQITPKRTRHLSLKVTTWISGSHTRFRGVIATVLVSNR